jgi:hypothetical protein
MDVISKNLVKGMRNISMGFLTAEIVDKADKGGN